MKAIILGSSGQLGSELQKIGGEFSHSLHFMPEDSLDITQSNQLTSLFDSKAFDVIINCAAYTAVDRAESEKDMALRVNATAVDHLAKLSKKFNRALIHISTDFIFDGEKKTPYTEQDTPHPLNVYGETKRKGEEAILNCGSKGAIIRTSWLYSSFGKNFVKTIAQLLKTAPRVRVVNDQFGSPTYAEDLARFILRNLEKLSTFEVSQTFHYSNQGVISWFQFAEEIRKILKLSTPLEAIPAKEYPTPAKRPAYSALDVSLTRTTFSESIPNWAESLTKCLRAET